MVACAFPVNFCLALHLMRCFDQVWRGRCGDVRRRADGADKDWQGDVTALRHTVDHHRQSRVPQTKSRFLCLTLSAGHLKQTPVSLCKNRINFQIICDTVYIVCKSNNGQFQSRLALCAHHGLRLVIAMSVPSRKLCPSCLPPSITAHGLVVWWLRCWTHVSTIASLTPGCSAFR